MANVNDQDKIKISTPIALSGNLREQLQLKLNKDNILKKINEQDKKTTFQKAAAIQKATQSAQPQENFSSSEEHLRRSAIQNFDNATKQAAMSRRAAEEEFAALQKNSSQPEQEPELKSEPHRVISSEFTPKQHIEKNDHAQDILSLGGVDIASALSSEVSVSVDKSGQSDQDKDKKHRKKTQIDFASEVGSDVAKNSGDIIFVNEDDVIKAKMSLNEDKRDKAVINRIINSCKYIEFTDQKEIDSLQEGLNLRNKLKAYQQKNDTDEEFTTQSASAETEAEKERRKSGFSRRRYGRSRSGSGFKAEAVEFVPREIEIFGPVIVSEIAHEMGIKASDCISHLADLGVKARDFTIIDADTAELLVEQCSHIPKRIKKLSVEDKAVLASKNTENYVPIPPVVTIMGHVDHGKTSLLDALRSTNVASGEAGGITQHIGAYQISLPSGEKVTFIDTPGHEAFISMRARGANATNVVILVVAADDGIMPQTIEAIKHAQSAGVPIVVAINKIDKPNVNPDKIKNELLTHGVVSEEYGGDAVMVPISAKERINLDKLLEAILLQAEVLDLRAGITGHASGVVLEARLDKQKGVVATVLVQNGLLSVGNTVIAGLAYGKIKLLLNDKGQNIKSAEPSTPVEVYGFTEVPAAGDKFLVLENEKVARDVISHRKDKLQASKTEESTSFSKEQFEQMMLSKDKQKKVVNVIVRTDVQGTAEALKTSLTKISNEEVDVKVMQASVGSITEADILLAATHKAQICAFNIKVAPKELDFAEKKGITIKSYDIIYRLIDDIKSIVSDNLAPIIREEVIGEAEVRIIFNLTKAGKIAGCLLKKGVAKRNAFVKVIRNGAVIFESTIKTLKHFKEDIKEISQGHECGIQIDRYDAMAEKDIIQIIEKTEERRRLA